MKIRKYLPVIFFILCFSMLFFIPNIKAFDDIDYEFQRDILFDESEPELNLFNMRDQQVYNGTYLATYSFTNDTVGEKPSRWISDEGGGSVRVIAQLDGHKKIIRMIDTDGGDRVNIENKLIGELLNGVIEFWIKGNDTTDGIQFILSETNIRGVNMRISDDKIQYFYSGSLHNATNGEVSNDIWYHFKIVFDNGIAMYNFSLNGIPLDNDIPFENNVSLINEVIFRTFNADSNYIYYVDAINYNFSIPFQIYDFSDDIIGEVPKGWTSQSTGNATTNIISGPIDSRVNILELQNFHLANPIISTPFNFSNEQNIVFDFAKDTYEGFSPGQMEFRDNISVLIAKLGFLSGDLYAQNGSEFIAIKEGFILLNTFYTIKVIFDSINNTYDVFVDDILRADNFHYITEADSISLLRIACIGSNEYKNYYDNILINLDTPLPIGTNLKPILEVLEGFEGLLETDKYEFSFLNVNEISEQGDTTFGLWNFATENNGLARIGNGLEPNIDRVVELIVNVEGSATITRTSLSITESLIDVNIGFNFTSVLSDRGNMTVLLESSDQTQITGFRIELASNKLYYFNGSWNNVLRTDIDVEIKYDINLFLNYDIDIVIMEYFVENILIDTYIFSMSTNGKTGLYEIDIEQFSDSDNSVCVIDYVGVYRNGESWHGELGIIIIPLNVSYHFERHYLYSSIGTGRYHQGIVEGSYIGGETPFQSIKNISTISGVPKDGLIESTNTYEFFWHNFIDTNLVLTCVGSDISFTSITIEGSKLVEGSNEYFLIYSSGGLDSRESYFYVQSNTLRFIHNTSIDDINEFIQVEFNIDDKTTVDTAISFTTNIDFNAFGFFRINFTDDTSQIIQMENTLKTKRFSLTTDKTIGSFIILVSDNNNNLIEGITTGLVKDISLLDIETGIISIISLNLVDMIIPLIIILLPTLAISGLYGDFLVIPLFILFSLILAITSIIPIWLFFVIVLSSSTLVFFEKDKRSMI